MQAEDHTQLAMCRLHMSKNGNWDNSACQRPLATLRCKYLNTASSTHLPLKRSVRRRASNSGMPSLEAAYRSRPCDAIKAFMKSTGDWLNARKNERRLRCSSALDGRGGAGIQDEILLCRRWGKRSSITGSRCDWKPETSNKRSWRGGLKLFKCTLESGGSGVFDQRDMFGRFEAGIG